MTIELAEVIIKMRSEVPTERSMLVGISGIDASGKGFVANNLAEQLSNFKTALIGADQWLNLPHVRFGDSDHGRHFYENAIRLDEMFERLILPLRQNRSIDLTIDYTEETATEFHSHHYLFSDIDIILLEGIFIFKKQFIDLFDLKIWIDCPFDVALRRAIARSQEGLSKDETINAYKTIYFPAQQHYFVRDAPQKSVDMTLKNY